MKITEITISAGRTFNHPYEQFSNFRPGLVIKMVPDEDGEEAIKEIKHLQAKIEGLMEEHKKIVLDALKLQASGGREIDLEEAIIQGQRKLDNLRKTGRQIQIDWSNS